MERLDGWRYDNVLKEAQNSQETGNNKNQKEPIKSMEARYEQEEEKQLIYSHPTSDTTGLCNLTYL